MKEILVYIVDALSTDLISQLSSDKDFIEEAERQENSADGLDGRVYSIKGFEKAFNINDVNSDNCFIRFIEVDK